MTALPKRSKSLTPPKRSLPVTHPALVGSGGSADRYVLGMARTELGALRILRNAPVPQTFCAARQRLLSISGGAIPVWEPAPCATGKRVPTA